MSRSNQEKRSSLSEVFKSRNFRLLWMGQTISLIGDALTLVAVPLLIFELTHSVTNLTTGFVIESLPWILIGPIAGVIVDWVNRRNVLLLTDLLRAILLFGILLSHKPLVIYVMLFCSQTLSAISAPVRSAVIPELIEKDLYVKAISLTQSTYQTVQIVGAFVSAGLLTLLGGPRASFLLDMLTFLMSFALTLMIRFPKESVKIAKGSQRQSFFRSFQEGIAFLLHHQVLRYVSSLNLLKAVTQAVVQVGSILYVKTELNLLTGDSDRLYSFVVAAIAIGIVAGTALISAFDQKWERRYLIIGGLMVQGLILLLIRLHPGSITTVLLFACSGFAASGALTPVSAFFAECTTNEVRGRVYSVVNSLAKVSMALGFWAAGLISEHFGVITLLVADGMLLFVATPLLTIFLRGFSALKQRPNVSQPTATLKS